MRFLVIVSLLLIFVDATAQDSVVVKQNFRISGYCKYLSSVDFKPSFRSPEYIQLLHNRVNMSYAPSERLRFKAEIRNRLFGSRGVGDNYRFATGLRNPHQYFDLQKSMVLNDDFLAHVSVERLFADWQGRRFNMRLGRQRINWGIATLWNPNDIFNSYNFLDFDYEERAGVDALFLKYFSGANSDLDFGFSFDEKNRWVLASRYFFNAGGYDWQVLAGSYEGSATLGAGWAGNIGEAGFKGELQYFSKRDSLASQLNATLEISHLLSKAWFVNTGLLYSKAGQNSALPGSEKFNLQISPRQPMPGRYSFFAGIQKEFSSLFSVSFQSVYSPGLGLVILLPQLSWSVADNLNAELFWQSFYQASEIYSGELGQAGFLRLRYSF
jgi:hypothetical protein